MILNAAIQFVSRVHRGFHHVVYSTVNRKSPRTSNLPPANTFLRSPFREHFWKNQTPDLQRHFQILNHLGLSIGRIGRTREPLELTSHCDFLFLRGGVLTPRPLASFYRVDFFRLMNTLDRGELGVVKIRDEYSWHSARIFFSTRTAFMRASSDRATTFQETKNVLILRRRFDLLPRN
jgi:hypothetical protein